MPTKTELLEKVSDRVWRQVDGDQAPQVAEFVRQYYGWVPGEDLEGRSPIDVYGAALSHWNLLARERAAGETRVRVYNPHHEEHGWQSGHTVVEVVTDDMPFLVDSTRMEINNQGYAIHLMVHSILKVRRDEAGRPVEVLPPGSEVAEGVAVESCIHVEVDRQTEPGTLEGLRACLERVLADVRLAVTDWKEMLARARGISSGFEENPPPIAKDDLAEAAAFLGWLADDNFTFLGYREYDLLLAEEVGEDALVPVEGSGLGILRQTGPRPRSGSFARLSPEVRRLARAPSLLGLTKANSRSTVHRPSYMDYVGVKRFDGEGTVVGEKRFLGLYTFSAYSAGVFEIPIIRRKVRYVLERAGFPKGSHNEKDLIEVLETYPRDELFQISREELFEISTGILHLQERQRVRLFVRRDTYGRFFSCLVFVPRDRFNTENRLKMQGILCGALGGENVEFNVRLTESVLARLHFTVYTGPSAEAPAYDVPEIEGRLVEATRTWTDDLYDALVESFGEERGVELFHRYRDAFPPGYRAGFLARTAVGDIRKIESLSSESDVGMSLYHPIEEPEEFLGFKLFRAGEQVSLSGILPLLENMGVEVVDERPHEVKPAGSTPVWIYDFGLLHEAGGGLQTGDVRDVFQDAFAQAWRGLVENDGFNRLVLLARMTWREISILRALCKYLRQTNTTFSQAYMEGTLARNPRIARLLVDLFRARLDPASSSDEDAARITDEIGDALDAVESLDEDRILRSFLDVVGATLRTNFFQTGPDGAPKGHLSLKLDPAKVPDLPLPRPMFEIFVYSPRVEGVHLRGGRVARGGLRWSDRREDFRTEVLGLMKAQQVKNAVIVPVGAKGGFVVKRPPSAGGREALMDEVVECYKTFVRGLLDVTDNLDADGEVVPPENVVRHDADDPYLVVAADKGTATFSDIANGISVEYGHWLGDAFASGGSAGYDHKEMGITARGAWESVKRHFREMGRDVQAEDFTAVGIGDMSGDVFGNGMLLSRHTKLVGAFNHLHIFFDPDPDPETSFAERERLFALPRSSWSDYDAGLISQGGGVFSRTLKSVPLSPEVREMLGVEAEALTPNEVIRAMLRVPVDLLYNGGIGTFVKASAETNAEVGDRSNDARRVDANELRCRVVGEGGNLGLTQKARVEYALDGGRVYTDAIDNSAGVDCSDHEVNIKILLGAAVANGDMTEKQRNALLAEMTEEVSRLVLRDNYEQTQALSNAVAQAPQMVDVHARYLQALEAAGRLDRRLEFLPDEEELARRRSEGRGLAAPEFAVLLAYTKLSLYGEVVASDVPEDPYLSGELERYFPSPLREGFREEMRGHRLRREILATHVVNGMVNRAGTTFAYRMGEETGAEAPDIARAYAAAREIFDADHLWAGIEALDNAVAAEAQTAMLLEGRRLVERATRWLLRNRRPPLDVEAAVGRFRDGVSHLGERLPELLTDGDREALDGSRERLVEAGVPQELANRVAAVAPMSSAMDVVDVAAGTGSSVDEAAAVYFALSGRLRFHWLREKVGALPRDDRWRTLARAALRDDLDALQAALTAEILRDTPDASGAPERVEAWAESNRASVGRALRVLSDVEAGGVYDISTLSVALREIRNLEAPVATAPTPKG